MYTEAKLTPAMILTMIENSARDHACDLGCGSRATYPECIAREAIDVLYPILHGYARRLEDAALNTAGVTRYSDVR